MKKTGNSPVKKKQAARFLHLDVVIPWNLSLYCKMTNTDLKVDNSANVFKEEEKEALKSLTVLDVYALINFRVLEDKFVE